MEDSARSDIGVSKSRVDGVKVVAEASKPDDSVSSETARLGDEEDVAELNEVERCLLRPAVTLAASEVVAFKFCMTSGVFLRGV